MKIHSLIATAAMLAVSTSASAQFTNGATNKSSNDIANTDGWNSEWLEYNPSTMKVDVSGADNESFNALSLGYSRAFNISAGTPLFVEAGIGVQYSFKTKSIGEDLGFDSEDYEICDPKQKFNMLSAKIPVSVMYAFAIPNSSVQIMPYAGIDLRFNITAKEKMEWNFTSEAERFFLGVKAGVEIDYDKLFLSISYTRDMKRMYREALLYSRSRGYWGPYTFNCWQLGIGMNF